jgi:hypothetical protein
MFGHSDITWFGTNEMNQQLLLFDKTTFTFHLDREAIQIFIFLFLTTEILLPKQGIFFSRSRYFGTIDWA